MKSSRHLRLVGAVAAAAAFLAGCGSSSSSTTTGPGTSEAQQAAAGDIPDNQQFLVYKNRQAGYSIKYPEGWARKGSPNDLTFADKDNQVHVAVSQGSLPSTAAAKAELERSLPSSAQLKIKTAQTETISGQKAIHITYDELGPPDPVTGKRLTLMVDRFVLARGGKVAIVDESTPVGVDNVDAYRLIIESFTWL
jgi:hypothetical protein